MAVVLAEKVHLAGRQFFTSLALASDITRVLVIAHRMSWPDAGRDTLKLVMEISEDDGATWKKFGTFGTSGGDHILRDGTVALSSTYTVWMPGSVTAKRQLRGWIDCKEDLRTKVEFELLTTTRPVRPPIHQSVAFITANSVQATNVSEFTIPGTSFTDTDNTFLFVGVGSSAPPADLTTSVTYDPGVGDDALTEKWDFINDTNWHNSGHFLVAPSTGTKAIDIVLAGADDEVNAGSMFFTGVDQTTPLGTHVEASASTSGPATVDVTSTTSGNLVVDNVWCGFLTNAVGASQTERWAEENVGSFSSGGGSTEPGNDGTVTMSWTLTSQSETNWVIGAVEILAAGAANDTDPYWIASGEQQPRFDPPEIIGY